MNIFKKKEQPSNNTISTEGETKQLTVFSYLIYNRAENKFTGSIKLTEEQAQELNMQMKYNDVDNNISFIRS
jgi:hypothetical protein